MHFCTSALIIMYCRSFSFAQVSLKEKLNLILSARPFVGGAHRLKGHRSSDIGLFIFLLFCWKPQVFSEVLVLFRFSKIVSFIFSGDNFSIWVFISPLSVENLQPMSSTTYELVLYHFLPFETTTWCIVFFSGEIVRRWLEIYIAPVGINQTKNKL